jgi:hypothetical protein
MKTISQKRFRLLREPEFVRLMTSMSSRKRGQQVRLERALRAKGYSYRLMQSVADALIKMIDSSLARSVARAEKKKASRPRRARGSTALTAGSASKR